LNPKQRDEALMGLISTKSSNDYKCASEPDISNSYFKEVFLPNSVISLIFLFLKLEGMLATI
jgi:hypothetical protein